LESAQGIFVSFLKLEQTHASEQLAMRKLALKTNRCFNKGGYHRTDLYYVRKLRTETEDLAEMGRKNMVDQRQVKWTTFSNLNLWFDTREGALVNIGFARRTRTYKECHGSLVFFEV